MIRLLAATLLTLGIIGISHAQYIGYPENAETNTTPNSNVGGTASSGTGVRTGHGPILQPIPPATSTLNPQQNPNRPQGAPGPALTYPSPQPFGSR